MQSLDTHEQIEHLIDELARRYAETHDPAIILEFIDLIRQLSDLQKYAG